MKKKTIILALLLAVSLPSIIPVSAYAMNWVTPSGAIVNDAGQLISAPPVNFTVKPATTTVAIKPCKPSNNTALARFFAAINCQKK